MDQAELYSTANLNQRKDAKKITEEYRLQWRSDDGGDTLLDVGCGSGDVLMDFIKPLLPKDFGLIVGTDISSKMVEFAAQQYKDDGRIEFRVLDIQTDELPNELREQFDHVTSFYCLHWVQDQKKAVQNIHRLLKKEGGDCLLVFVVSYPFYDFYVKMKSKEKWSIYITDLERFFTPLYFSENPVEEFNNMLSETGFIKCNVQLRTSIHHYTTRALQDFFKSTCPFAQRMPENVQHDFVEECFNWMKEQNLFELDDKKEARFLAPCKLIVAYARKSDNDLEKIK